MMGWARFRTLRALLVSVVALLFTSLAQEAAIAHCHGSHVRSGEYSINQIQEMIRKGHAPAGITAAHRPHTGATWEKKHIHIKANKKNVALNKDGTWRHGSAKLTKKQKDWLKKVGWKLPK